MSKFIITTDSSCDGSYAELQSKNIPVIFFNYSDENKVYQDTMDEKGYKTFYQNIKSGTVYKTSQINPQAYYDFFKPLLKNNLPIIHVTLGSGLSNTINSIYIAISMLKEDFPNCDIKVIDSKIASLGLMLIVDELMSCQDANMDADTTYEKVVDKVLNVNAYYTTDTLTYFARGGRLSKVEAFLGNALKINPILDCDADGKLRIVEKVRGSKKALDQLVKRIKDQVIEPEKQYIYVCHADDEVKGTMLGNRLVNEVGFKGYKLYFMGPIIGSHTGPGLVATFFYGKARSNQLTSLNKNQAEELQKELNKNYK